MFCICTGGFSWGQTLIPERRIGCTQVDTLTGITLTAPTFIDAGGVPSVKISSLIGFTLSLSI